jgi:tRNA A37 methylthiotransferase MiaB
MLAPENNLKVHDKTIATDIIAGFPTETSKDFEETMKNTNFRCSLSINFFRGRVHPLQT